jgi:hypothetical protein
MSGMHVLDYLCLFSGFVFPFGVWVAAVDAFEAADRIRAGVAEGGFILRAECISRIIKFDSKQTNKQTYGALWGLLGPEYMSFYPAGSGGGEQRWVNCHKFL